MIVLKDPKRLKEIVLSGGDYGYVSRALRDPAFDWGFLPEILASEKLDITSFDALSSFSYRWVVDEVNWDALLVRLEQLYALSSNVEKRMFFSSFNSLVNNVVIVDKFLELEDVVVLPESFIVGFYNFLTPGEWESYSYWLHLVAYPGLSDEFKKRVWLERWDSIVEEFVLGQDTDFVQMPIRWGNVPGFVLFNIVSFINADQVADAVQFFGAVALEAWRTGLVEGLQGSYPELNFEGLPFEWVEEFYLSSTVRVVKNG